MGCVHKGNMMTQAELRASNPSLHTHHSQFRCIKAASGVLGPGTCLFLGLMSREPFHVPQGLILIVDFLVSILEDNDIQFM